MAKENFTVEADLLDGHDVEHLFDRKWMTLLNWRKNRAFPYVLIPGQGKRTVRYRLSLVLEWAKTHEVEIITTRLKEIEKRIARRRKQAA